MRRAGLLWALLFAAGSLQAAPPAELVETRLEGVDVAARQVIADGLTWALSSTATIALPGKPRATFRDLRPGMNVRLVLVPTDGEVPVIRSITVLPD
jgi:hypothetical protein